MSLILIFKGKFFLIKKRSLTIINIIIKWLMQNNSKKKLKHLNLQNYFDLIK